MRKNGRRPTLTDVSFRQLPTVWITWISQWPYLSSISPWFSPCRKSTRDSCHQSNPFNQRQVFLVVNISNNYLKIVFSPNERCGSWLLLFSSSRCCFWPWLQDSLLDEISGLIKVTRELFHSTLGTALLCSWRKVIIYFH